MIDKDKISVTMTMKQYEELHQGYQEMWDIKRFIGNAIELDYTAAGQDVFDPVLTIDRSDVIRLMYLYFSFNSRCDRDWVNETFEFEDIKFVINDGSEEA